MNAGALGPIDWAIVAGYFAGRFWLMGKISSPAFRRPTRPLKPEQIDRIRLGPSRDRLRHGALSGSYLAFALRRSSQL